MGEIHATYDDALLDEIRASGLRGCVVTVGNPALQGADAFDDMRKEIAEFDQLIAARPARWSKAVKAADLERAAAQQTIGLVYYPQNATPLEDKVELNSRGGAQSRRRRFAGRFSSAS